LDHASFHRCGGTAPARAAEIFHPTIELRGKTQSVPFGKTLDVIGLLRVVVPRVLHAAYAPKLGRLPDDSAAIAPLELVDEPRRGARIAPDGADAARPADPRQPQPVIGEHDRADDVREDEADDDVRDERAARERAADPRSRDVQHDQGGDDDQQSEPQPSTRIHARCLPHRRSPLRRRAAGTRRLTAFVAWALACGVACADDWPVFGHDPARSGVAGGRTLNPANVARLYERWHTMLGEVADSAPIVVRDRLYVTAKSGTTYAVDATQGRILWRFTTHGSNITTASPAFDPGTNALYVAGVDGALHRLDPADGRELRANGFPARITTAPETEKNASSLNIASGYLYAQTSGYFGDATPYVGHVVAIRLRDGRMHVFNVLCSDRHALIAPQSCGAQRAGMWSRAGVVVDPDAAGGGRIYVATGNGPFDRAAGAYGDSILALSADAGRLLASSTPSNAAELESSDLDVGSTSPALLPRQAHSTTPLLAVQGGKDSVLRLLDRTRLGRELQRIALGDELFSAPAAWNDARGTTWVFIGLGDGVHAYRVATRNGASRLESAWHAPLSGAREGASPVVADGVVFVATSGALIALDARNGERLWTGNAIGAIHWESPAVANGAIYCPDENGGVTAYAL
jgi:outer membrane protein assembly factor BamB